MLYKILVALDDSSLNRLVFNEAVDLARQTGASLMLLHVRTPEESYIPYYYPIITDKLLQQYEARWEADENRELEMLRSLAGEAPEVAIEFTQNMGDPGRVICNLAKDWGANLIVTGRRGKTGLTELFMGSVSNYVTHHAPCSVLVVQGKVQNILEENIDSASVKHAA
jgi:nucleotide-binding universal stress UspA family protein